jgi:hypothetical protein
MYNLEMQNESEKRSRRGLLKKDQGEEREKTQRLTAQKMAEC